MLEATEHSGTSTAVRGLAAALALALAVTVASAEVGAGRKSGAARDRGEHEAPPMAHGREEGRPHFFLGEDRSALAPPGSGSRPRGGKGMGFVVESEPVAFGDMLPGGAEDAPGAILVRVFSDRDWTLTLVPRGAMQIVDRNGSVPVSRLRWRAGGTNAAIPFREGEAARVARGSRTSGAGELVSVDLHLQLDENDPLGRYATALQVVLEQR